MNFFMEKLSEGFCDVLFNPKDRTLIECYFIDSNGFSFPQKEADRIFIPDFWHHLKSMDFVKKNFINSSYAEPFNSWSEVPMWYLNECSWGGAFLLKENFNYYLAAFMHAYFLREEDSRRTDFTFDAWFDLLFDNSNKPNERFFNLTEPQKKICMMFFFENPMLD